jgi:translocation and assembly module TamB
VQLDHSQLRQRPIKLNAHGVLRQPERLKCAAAKNGSACDAQLSIDQLELQSADSRLEVSGDALPPFNLQGHLDSPDLAQLDPRLGGKAHVQFTLQGPLATPHIVSQGQASQLRYQQLRIAALHWNADVDPQVDSHIDLSASDGDLGAHIDHLQLTLQGLEVYHHAQLDLSSDQGDVHATAQGGYDRKRQEWGGELSALQLTPERLAPWTLQKPVGILLGEKRFSVEPACLGAEGGRLCLTLMHAVLDPGLHLNWDLSAVPLQGFKPLLPAQLDLAGKLDGNGQLHWLDGDLSDTRAQLTVSGGRLSTRQNAHIDFATSSLQIEQSRDGLHATLALNATQGRAGADLSAANADRFVDRPLSGHLDLEVPDLGVLQPFVRELRAVGGRIDGSLTVGGSIEQPKLDGALALHEGHAILATPGIQLTDVELQLKGNGAGPLVLAGDLHSGGGALHLGGTVDPSVSPPSIDLQLKGDRFQAADLSDVRIWVSPDLHLQSGADGATLSGTLTVPKAELTPQGLGDNPGVTVSRDQVLVGTPAEQAGPSLRIRSNVRFALGDDVHFKGFGLTTRLEGAVNVNDDPVRGTTGQGELQLVDGHYKAYGQDLTIDSGRLIFDSGPVTQPGVDVSAYRQPQSDIRVGVRVRGSLDQPLLSLYSDPAMAREQQLSWLLFGRPLDQNSSADRNMVSSAALSLGLGGGDFLLQKIGHGVGLDTVSVGSAPGVDSEVAADPSRISGSQASYGAGSTADSASQAAQLTLGKYLTPRIFVSYGVNLFQTGQTFRLLYDVGHGFKLQTETSITGSGGDVIYSIDRGH